MSVINQTNSSIPNLPPNKSNANITQNPDLSAQASTAEVVENIQIKKETISENYKQSDQELMLIQLKLNNSDLNRSLLQGFLEYGLPLTEENFKLAHSLISQGEQDPSKVNSQTLQAVLVTMRKGLSTETAAFKILQSFYQQGSQLNQQTMALFNLIAQLKNVLLQSQQPIVVSLAAILSRYDEEYKNFKQDPLKKPSNEFFKRLMGDSLAMFSFLSNLSTDNNADMKLLEDLKQKFGDFIKSMSQQFILSKNDSGLTQSNLYNFDVFEVPNILGAKASSIEIIVKYKSKNSSANDKNIETFIISFDTEELGKIVLTVKVLNEQDLAFLFQAERESSVKEIYNFHEDIESRMRKFSYNLKSFEVKRKVIDLNSKRLELFSDYQKIRIDV